MNQSDKQSVFLDTNILIRSTVVSAPQHSEARRAVEKLWKQGAVLWISRQVLREYASNITRPQTFMQPLSGQLASQRLRQFQATFNVAEETQPVTDHLLTLLDTIPLGGKQVHDANIVATMQVYGIAQLLTFNDADFLRFSSLITVLTVAVVLQETTP